MRFFSRHTFRKTFIFLLLALIFSLSKAQENRPVVTDSLNLSIEENKPQVDSVEVEPKKEKIKKADTTGLFSSGIYLKLDYGKLLTYFSDFESKLEGEFGIILFKRLVLNGSYGVAELNPKGAYKNVEYYTIEGDYMRFGMEYYFSINPKNFLTLGGKYSMSTYSDDGKFLVGSEFWEEYEEEFGSENLEAQWVEIVLNTETRLAKNLFLGTQFSLRFMLDFETREDIPVYAIPGYGRYFDKSIPAANLFIRYKIPF